MRQSLLISFLFGISVLQVNAQQSDKYHLVIPAKWDDAKFLYHLTELIPKHAERLVNQQLCLSCPDTGYTVTLLLTRPVLFRRALTNITTPGENRKDSYNYQITYSFFASLRFDYKGSKAAEEMIIVDSLAYFNKEKIFTGNSTQSTDADMQSITKGRSTSLYQSFNKPSDSYANAAAFNANTFMDEHLKQIWPAEQELRAIVFERVRKLIENRN
jgi:hypothetical protein